ncbi:MAG: Uma2 family endonuclease [Clostridiales bacterium]|nr:Uma2 family endonuclease [Clostridiales bacterium]
MANIALERPFKFIGTIGKEIIGGKVYNLVPANIPHQRVESKLIRVFGNFFEDSPCEAIHGAYLHLKDGERLSPDLMVVCNPEIIMENGVHGTPDLVVEILSRSTKSRDRREKMQIYEKNGVKEYWIVDVGYRTIEVYLLENGKYRSDNIYFDELDAFDLEEMTEKERAEISYEIKPSMFDDFSIDVRELFRGIS